MSSNRPIVLAYTAESGLTPEFASRDGLQVNYEAPGSSTTRLGIEEIYPDVESRPQQLSIALGLLHRAEIDLEGALSAIRANDDLSSDDEVTRYSHLLPEMFCLRELGDGFAVTVSSLFYAHRNRHGVPLDERQIIGLIRVVRTLRKQIFMSFDAACEVLEPLSELGLDTDAPLVDVITETGDG